MGIRDGVFELVCRRLAERAKKEPGKSQERAKKEPRKTQERPKKDPRKTLQKKNPPFP
tara:strand:+ start:318 stop:491 length:174 start_codon:yes stop_codon:yes gene_type:complete